MHKNRTTALFILSIITFLLVACAFFFFLVVIKNKNEHTGAVLTTLETKIIKKANETSLTAQAIEAEETEKVISSYFVNRSEIDSFVGYLENIGIRTHTTVKVEGIEVVAQSKNVLTVRLSSLGEFSSVMQTLKILENAPYQIHIGQVYINKRIQDVVTDTKGVAKVKQVPIWQADISFTILLSS